MRDAAEAGDDVAVAHREVEKPLKDFRRSFRRVRSFGLFQQSAEQLDGFLLMLKGFGVLERQIEENTFDEAEGSVQSKT